MNDFWLGINIGILQTIIGHPFDTIKTNSQNNNKNIYKLNYLYRGIKFPIVSSSISNGFIFYINELILKKSNNNYYTSGFLTGFITAPLINIFETHKVQAQTNNIIKQSFYKNFKAGCNATIFRESIACSIYFGLYNQCKQNNINTFISGSISGCFSWLITYPIDVVKTRLQSGLSKNYIDAIKLGNFSSGISICLLRSFIVNGVTFSMYDYNKK